MNRLRINGEAGTDGKRYFSPACHVARHPLPITGSYPKTSEERNCSGGLRPPAVHFAKDSGGQRPPLQRWMGLGIGSNHQSPIAPRAPRSARGFTLVELMAVIVVIGIVSGIVIAGAGYANKMAMKSRTQATVQQVCTAIEMFYADRGFYPSDLTCYQDAGTQSTLTAKQLVWPCESLWFWLEYNNPHMQPQYQKAPYIISSASNWRQATPRSMRRMTRLPATTCG